MTRYIVDVTCSKCGRRHRLANEFLIKGGPSTAGNLAELYAGELPQSLVTLLDTLVWGD